MYQKDFYTSLSALTPTRKKKKVTILPYTAFPNFRKGIAVSMVSGIDLCLNNSNMWMNISMDHCRAESNSGKMKFW